MSIPDWIHEPTIIMFGCQAWPPKGCPCGGAVRDGDDSIYCAVCDSMSPRRERQVRAARAGLKARDRAETGEQKAKAELRKRDIALTEIERRLVWNGYKGGALSPNAEVTNRSKVGREWLTEIGQEPDWSLILDGRGNVVGRFGPELETE